MDKLCVADLRDKSLGYSFNSLKGAEWLGQQDMQALGCVSLDGTSLFSLIPKNWDAVYDINKNRMKSSANKLCLLTAVLQNVSKLL